MPILKILPSAIDSTANYAFGSVTANGVDLGATVAAAFNAANTVSPLDSFARQTANAAFLAANTKLSTSGGTITGNLIVNAITSNTITANGVDLGTAVASAFLLANNASRTTTSNTAPSGPNVGDMWFDTITSITFRYTNDGVSNNWIDITGPQNAGFIYQSYSLTPNTTSINETTGNTVIYTVATTNTADNTTLYWTNSGTTAAADFRDGISNGTVIIINNSATITRSLVADVTTETSETIILSLRTDSNTGTVVAVSPTVTVGDTSITPAFYSVEYLVVAGGGANGGLGGGGGGGGYLSGAMNVTSSTGYTVTIGAGGTSAQAYSGGNTIFAATSTITSVGGGAGGTSSGGGYAGGSGGGGYAFGGAGTAGQGRNGSGGAYQNGFAVGGAGGAGQEGVGPIAGTAGKSGDGLQWLDGNYYAGGGSGGGNYSYMVGTPGLGGGGYNSNGEPNTGGGAGAGSNYNLYTGGSGVVIIRYLTAGTDSGGNPIQASGGTANTSGLYTYRKFTTSGTFTA
jgi:hypothetical protein